MLKFDFFGTAPFLDIAGVIAFLGLLLMIKRKSYFIPFWLLLICIFEPRSYDRFGIIPVALLFSYGVYELLLSRLPAKEYLFQKKYINTENIFALLCCLPVFLSIPAVYVNQSPLLDSLSRADQQAMAWVKANTPAGSRFLVIPSSYWQADSISEWFPALTDRTSLLTVQGTEWTDSFESQQEEVASFIQMLQGNDFSTAIARSGSSADYLYCSLNQNHPVINYCPNQVNQFNMVYDQGNVRIYQRISQP